MQLYELTMPGFNGSTDQTDDLVFWVGSELTEAELQAFLLDEGVFQPGEEHKSVVAIPDVAISGNLDYSLPLQIHEFKEYLKLITHDKLTRTQLNCYVRVSGNATHMDDKDLAGTYLVTATPSSQIRAESLSDTFHCHLIAKAVLDEFHFRQGIKVLEDFDITVYLENGIIINEMLFEPTGHFDESVTAEFCGPIDDKDLQAILHTLMVS
jgi:hypothetical protein